MSMNEILGVLADEIEDTRAHMSMALANFTLEDEAGRKNAADQYLEEIRRIGSAAEVLGLEGVSGLHRLIERNVQTILALAKLSPEVQFILERWPQLLRDYLRTPNNVDTAQKLAFLFTDPNCPEHIDSDSAEALQAILLKVSLEQMAERTAEDNPARATEATFEDVALDIPTDVNPRLVEAFLGECPPQAAHFSAALQQVIQGEAGVEKLNEVRRVVHSIKGAANTVGVRGVANIAHHMEDILELMAANSIRPEGALARLLMQAADCLEMMFETLVEGKEAPPQALSVLQQILDSANRMDLGEFDLVPEASEPSEPIAPAIFQETTSLQKKEEKPAAVTDAAALVPKLRVATSTLDGMLRLSGEMTISRSNIQERLNQALKQVNDLREYHARLWQRSGDLESLVTIQGVATGETYGKVAYGSGQSAKDSIFDALEMDQYSQMHGEVHAMVEAIADLQTIGSNLLDTLSAIGTAVTQQDLVNIELHETVLGARMVVAGSLEPRLARTLRQACEATGKRATLTFIGGDVMLDDQMINDLVDPLAHLLRNAVDHGIEAPSWRATVGKPEAGSIILRFVRAGSYIVIECADDGAGLDLSLIRDLAVRQGLIEEARELKDEDIARLILLQGFSTKAEVSQVSGRGVGMDIVHNTLTRLKGEIDIQSKQGSGSRMTLRVPMNLGNAHCLLVRAGDDTVAVPTENLERVVYAGAARVERSGRAWLFRDEIDTCAAYDLSDLLGYAEEDSLGGANDQRPVVILRDGKNKVAIVLDKLLGGRDFVIKGLGRYLSSNKGAIGASLTGDGRVLPVLDVNALLRRRHGVTNNVVPLLPRVGKSVARASNAADILVVDDSLSVRTSLTQFLNSEGYATRTAKDGIEALEEMARHRPAALLVDLEMPRMNGLELTQRLRAQPETQAIPIIMITSRAAEKHRKQAQLAGVDLYVTKPYREDYLLAQLRSMLTKAA